MYNERDDTLLSTTTRLAVTFNHTVSRARAQQPPLSESTSSPKFTKKLVTNF